MFDSVCELCHFVLQGLALVASCETRHAQRLLGIWDLAVARARLAQSAERKALNLVVVGSSPTVGVLFTVLALAVTIHEAVQ